MSLHQVPDYSRFRFECVVDFVEIGLVLERRAQAWTVRDVLGATYVRGLDKEAGNAATRFIARFDDILCWDQVSSAVKALDEKWGLVEPPRLVTLEVALDAYSKS